MTNQPPADYDSPWKEALDRYFEAFMAFFFPVAHADINWDRGCEFLDTELQQVVRDAELGRRLADKLVKVWRSDGFETLVLVHVEVQIPPSRGGFTRNVCGKRRIFINPPQQPNGCTFTTTGYLTATSCRWRP